jgi:DNA repair protein RadC
MTLELAVDWFRRNADAAIESLACIVTDAAGVVVAAKIIATGTEKCVVVDPRKYFKFVLEQDGAGCFSIHNHPGGTPRASGHDLDLYKDLDAGADILRLAALPHVITTPEDFFVVKLDIACV